MTKFKKNNITFILQKWYNFTNNKISINGDETYVIYWMHDKIFKQTSVLFFKNGKIYKHKISINGD
jgi:hypothetical protein